MKPLIPPLWLFPRRLIPVLPGACLLLLLLARPAAAIDYPWTILTPQNDSRNPDVRAYDEALTAVMVAVMNRSEDVFHHHFVLRKTPIAKLLSAATPFCELHFDAVNPLILTDNEKAILQEYLKRGGFILFFIDCYPYTQDEFWSVSQWPVIDFLKRELPAADPQFTIGKATDDFPIFRSHYRTQTEDSIRHELTGNPNTPNRTLVFYRKRLCCFVMGRYSYLEDDAWIAQPRPFNDFGWAPKSYQLVVNVYNYALLQ